MLPPLFPRDSPKLELLPTDVATMPSHATEVGQASSRSIASLHAGAWIVGAFVLTVFGVVGFFAMGIVTSSPSTASSGVGIGGPNGDLGNVYGTWTDLPQQTIGDQPEVIEVTSLNTALSEIINRHSDHTFGVVVAPVEEGSQVRIHDDYVFTGASTTKLLTAAAILSGVDSGRWKLDHMAYELRSEAEKSSSDTQVTASTPGISPTPSPTPTPAPQPVTVEQALRQMVNRSNNTAWEQLIHLVGPRSLRQYAAELGMKDYDVNQNRVSARDLALLLQKIYSGQLLSDASTQLLLSYMQQTNEERMIPAAITDRGEVYHKYGWLGSVVHDVGVVDNFGKPIIVVLMSDGSSSYADRTEILREMAEAVEQSLLVQN